MLIALLILARGVHIAASILIAGTFTFEIVAFGFIRRQASNGLHEIERSLDRLAVWTLLTALVSAVLWFWLEVVNMSGLSFGESFSASTWKTILLGTVFGHVWEFRLCIIVAALTLAIPGFAGNNVPRRPTIPALWFLSVVLLMSLAWISHAAAAGWQPISLIGDALHLYAAGAWIGGLVPLVICLTRAGASSSITKNLPPVLSRFSTLSLCCVSVLIATGICNSVLLVGSIRALFTTLYGWLLLSKVALFGILIGLGARNRVAIKATPSTAQTRSGFLQQLRRNIISEICFGTAVVTIVACLGVTPPARHP